MTTDAHETEALRNLVAAMSRQIGDVLAIPDLPLPVPLRSALCSMQDAAEAARIRAGSAAREDGVITRSEAEAYLRAQGIDPDAATARIMARVRAIPSCDGCGAATHAEPDRASGIVLCAACAPGSAPATTRVPGVVAGSWLETALADVRTGVPCPVCGGTWRPTRQIAPAPGEDTNSSNEEGA